MIESLPRGEGVAVFAGDGDWWPRTPSDSLLALEDTQTNAALVLSEPTRVMAARTPEEIPGLLDEVQSEQTAGRYVAGYLSYEAGAAYGLSVRAPTAEAPPLAWMAAYAPSSATRIPLAEWKRLLACLDVSSVADTLAAVEPELSVSRDEYIAALGRVHEYIAAGDTYQVNYTVRGRFELAAAPGTGAAPPTAIDPLDYFLALVIRQPVPYAAYLDLGHSQILSLSPELFLRRDGHTLQSRPMKGTRPRGATHGQDVALAYELALTEKERAENLMIVDMVRNDLGRLCRAGTVRVPTIFAVEPYRTVWQMVSTVAGDLSPRATLSEIMKAVFPGASITGAPKHHTMEIIAELETEPREVYTGSVGLFSPGGDFAANIAIRTITHRQGSCRLGVGSGVVWDANAAAEYDETLAKAAFATPPPAGPPPRGGPWRPDTEGLLRTLAAQDDFFLFETILLREAAMHSLHTLSEEAVLARYAYLREHLDRMAASAHATGLPFDVDAAHQLLAGLARVNPEALVARLQLDSSGCFSFSTRATPTPPAGPVTLMVSPFRTDIDDPLLRHKTGVRGFYDREHRRALSQGHFDALFLNRLGRVTEGAISNLFARFGDTWLTPPVGDGLLPGVWRASFIEQTGAREVSLSTADLSGADALLAGNSVRGAVSVDKLASGPLLS